MTADMTLEDPQNRMLSQSSSEEHNSKLLELSPSSYAISK